MTTHKRIADLVINLTGIDIYQKCKKQEIVDARCLFDYIMREKCKSTLSKIVDHYRKQGLYRHHATIIHSSKLWQDVCRRKPEYRRHHATIIGTELSNAQYQNAYELVGKLKTKKQLTKFRSIMQQIIQ